MPKKKPIDWEQLDGLVDQGMNCKQIAAHYNFTDRKFCVKAKKHLGIYLSQYIHNKKYGKP